MDTVARQSARAGHGAKFRRKYRPMRIWPLAFVLLVPSFALAQPAQAPDAGAAQPASSEPRYLTAMRNELTAMRVRGAECEATDAARAQCTFTARGITTGRDFEIHLVYSDHT